MKKDEPISSDPVERLRESEAKYRTFLNTWRKARFAGESDGILIDANPAALEIFGLTRDQFLGKTFFDPPWKMIGEDGEVISPEQYPSMVAFKTGKPVKDVVIAIYNGRTDSHKWVCVNATPLFKPGEDAPDQVFVTLHDITDRKKPKRR